MWIRFRACQALIANTELYTLIRVTRFFSSSLPEEEVRRLYCEMGLSTLATAAVLGCTDAAVRRRLVQLGIPRRTPWEHDAVTCDPEEVRRLYVECDLSTTAVAAQIGVSDGVVRRRLEAMGVKRRGVGKPRYARRDFDGDACEKAYLIGFRLGDLHVALEGDTVVVRCTSTRQEQIDLFRSLFEAYGHVYTDEARLAHRRRQSIAMETRLNRTFDFLLPKEDRVPDWVLADEEALYAYFAGYCDAEGYIKVAPPRPGHAAEVRVEIRSYDALVLKQLADALREHGVTCPAPSIRVGAGYVNRAGVRSNQALWGLCICRRQALDQLFRRLDPHLRHGRRRRDMERAVALLSDKERASDRRRTNTRQFYPRRKVK